MSAYAVYSPSYVTHMKFANLVFPSVNWISVNLSLNLVIALSKLWYVSKQSHAQVPTNDNSCLFKTVAPQTGWASGTPDLAENADS